MPRGVCAVFWADWLPQNTSDSPAQESPDVSQGFRNSEAKILLKIETLPTPGR
jgi:hypothetical protein